jgi:hypothetical protein
MTSFSTRLCHQNQPSAAQASFKMCYQVIERYTFCRCLYCKHAIDSCSAHGQRGHAVQEKTVLVGYACSLHSKVEGSGTARVSDGNFKLRHDTYDSSDDSDRGTSIFSTAMVLSRATSFISADEDTIQNILQVLLEDPLLRWENLVGQQHRHDHPRGKRDVRFFLKAFEVDLRANAGTSLEQQTCSFFRSRIRYLSSQICERFNLVENEDETILKVMEPLALVTVDEPDPASMPTFSKIRNFMFGGDSFQGLKDNVRNYTQKPRDYIREMVDVITKNIHPPVPAIASAWESEKYERCLHLHLEVFLLALAADADLCNLSASDRIGIESLLDKVSEISTRIRSCWTHKLPMWHFYPPIIKGDRCTQSVLLMEVDSSYEAFETFTSSSSAFLDLARGLASRTQNTPQATGAVKSSTPIKIIPNPLAVTIPNPSAVTAPISYQCVSLFCTHSDIVANSPDVVMWPNHNRCLY